MKWVVFNSQWNINTPRLEWKNLLNDHESKATYDPKNRRKGFIYKKLVIGASLINAYARFVHEKPFFLQWPLYLSVLIPVSMSSNESKRACTTKSNPTSVFYHCSNMAWKSPADLQQVMNYCWSPSYLLLACWYLSRQEQHLFSPSPLHKSIVTSDCKM